MEKRKEEEAGFHDKVRGEQLKKNKEEYTCLTSNKKFYSVVKQSWSFTENWLNKRCPNKKVLDYCCGNGELSIILAKKGANVFGIDISPISVENAKKQASLQGMDKTTTFLVMDAEKLDFEDNFFDVIVCHGVLHHLDVKKAFPELARVLKPQREVICVDPLAYNPIFQLYRKLTPHLRTAWETEHILGKKDLNIAKEYFGKVETRFFHLFVLAAVLFRKLPAFNPILKILEKIDSAILKLPVLKWLAWQIVFILSEPKKK